MDSAVSLKSLNDDFLPFYQKFCVEGREFDNYEKNNLAFLTVSKENDPNRCLKIKILLSDLPRLKEKLLELENFFGQQLFFFENVLTRQNHGGVFQKIQRILI